jgi:hypothetical protein
MHSGQIDTVSDRIAPARRRLILQVVKPERCSHEAPLPRFVPVQVNEFFLSSCSSIIAALR